MKKQNLLFFGDNQDLLRSRIKDLKESYVVYYITQNVNLYMDEELKNMKDVIALPYDLNHKISVEEMCEIAKVINNVLKEVKINNAYYLYEVRTNLGLGVAWYYNRYLYALALFYNIILEYEINIVFCEEMPGKVEVDALKDIAHNRGMKLHFVRKRVGSFSEAIERLYFICCKIPLINKIILLETQLRKIYRLKKKSVGEGSSADCNIQKYDVALLIESDANKDINRELENLELEGIEKKFKYCIFCYKASFAEKRLIELGKVAKLVDSCFNLKTALLDYWNYLKDIFMIARHVRKIHTIYFRDMNVTKAVKRIYIDDQLSKLAFEYMLYEGCVYHFLQKNQPKLIMTTDSSSNFISVITFYHCAKKLNLDIKFCNNVVGLDSGFGVFEFEFESNADMIDIRLFSYGSQWPEMFKKRGWHGEAFCVSDKKMRSKYEMSNSFPNKVGNMDSNPKILWAPGNLIVGMFSFDDFIMNNNVILENTKRSGYNLIVKYHPHQSETIVKGIMQQYGKCKNINFVNQKCDINDCIDRVDIVITTYSTVIFDASMRGKLVIGVDNGFRRDISRNLENYFYLTKIDDIDFEKILFDLDFREQQIKKQNAFFEQRFANPDNLHIVDVLQRYM